MSTGPPPALPERPEALGPPPPPRDERPWRAVLAVPIALSAVFAGMLAFLLADAARSALTTEPMSGDGLAGAAAHGSPPALTLFSTFVQDVALIGGSVLVAAAALGGRLRPSALGLRRAPLGRSVAYVLGGYVLFLVLAAGWTSALGIEDRENVAIDLGTRDSTAALIGAALLVCVMAPLAEEIFFRGFLYGALRKRGVPIAALVSGLAFGLAHVASSPIGFIVPLGALGILLCLLYERTGSLYPCIALHCLNNSVAFGVGDGRAWLVPVVLAGSGLVLAAILRTSARVLGAAPHAARAG